jgi:hypothetical protein
MARRRPKKEKLTQAQKRFVIAVAEGRGKAEAYAVAYPRSAGWKPESRAVAASHLLARDIVAEAYAAELARVEEEERRRADWTRQKSIAARLDFKRRIEEELERRRVATLAEAETLRQSPPTDRTPGEVVGEICRILQKPILTAGAASAYHANLDGLDKAAGIDREGDGIEAEAVTFTAWPSTDGGGNEDG